MSHFAVLVIGDDVDHQLAPFHEYECTGIQDEFVTWIDEHDDLIQEYKKADKKDYPTFQEYVEDYGYEFKDGRAGRYTNPDAKWDWYVEGGRWANYLLLKDGTYADSALKKEIDFDTMRANANQAANEIWDSIEKAHKEAGITTHDSFKSFDEICNNPKFKDDIDEARKAYHEQPRVKAIHKGVGGFFVDAEDYAITREEFVKRKMDNCMVFYALVHNREWYARGDMGWWGISSNEKDANEYSSEYAEKLSQLPDDTRITVVDCHI